MPDVELVTTLKRKATKIIADVRKKKRPLLITQHGRPAAYLVDAESYEKMQDRVRILEALAHGEEAIRQRRVLTHAQFKKKMARWLK
jgi:prevent-host-death family protein